MKILSNNDRKQEEEDKKKAEAALAEKARIANDRAMKFIEKRKQKTIEDKQVQQKKPDPQVDVKMSDERANLAAIRQ
jgi:hypothetical protein